jgi:CheY-like chemotaxis protein
MAKINASSKSVLVIHYHKMLLELLALKLKQAGYTVRTACDAEEGLRLFEHCGPFKVVLVNYDLPKKDGVEVAMGILERNPSQGMIITAFDYASEEEVPRPKELMHIPVLIDPRKVDLRRSLERVQESSASELASAPSKEAKETHHTDQAVLDGAPSGNETTMAAKAELPDRAVADEKQFSAEAS